MKNNFRLYSITKSGRKPITIFEDLSETQLTATFDEHIEFAEHDQLTLTFSMMKYIPVHGIRTEHMINPNINLLQFGSKVELFDGTRSYMFIVTGITPTIYSKNVKYDYVCKDEISFTWPKRYVGMSYSTLELGGVQTIYEIATTVLRQTNIQDWRAEPNEFIEESSRQLTDIKISLEIENSNPYNIILEACNALNATMLVDWTRKILSFVQKSNIKFKGLRYRCDTNLQDLSVSASADDMVSILHVYGGSDEFDQVISLMPPLTDQLIAWWKINHKRYESTPIEWADITTNEPWTKESQDFINIAKINPALGNFLYDFTLFEQNKVLTSTEYATLINVLQVKMAYNNMWLKYYEPLYWLTCSELYGHIQQAKTHLENSYINNLKYDPNSDAAYLTILNSIQALLPSVCNTNDITNGVLHPKNEILSQFLQDKSAYKEQLNLYKTKLNALPEKEEDRDMEEECMYQSYTSRIKTLNIMNQVYEILYNDIVSTTVGDDDTITDKVQLYKNANALLWKNLYVQFGHVIYEGTYQDTNELNSVGLYNAAISEFIKRHHPCPSFSIAVLDLSTLAGLGDNHIRSCDKIRIYNKDLNLSEAEGSLNNLSYTNNELIVESVNYDLRDQTNISVTVQQIHSYKSILQKLIQTV